jgi:CheY-like chemotaxis protein
VALNSVLIADDSRIFRTLISEVLREHGLKVIQAADGREALDTALSQRPQLLILDALMPLLSGFDVISKVRGAAPDYRPVVFIVTAVYKSRRWESEARRQYRVDEYLEKPLEPEDLVKAIGRHFPEFLGLPQGGS